MKISISIRDEDAKQAIAILELAVLDELEWSRVARQSYKRTLEALKEALLKGEA